MNDHMLNRNRIFKYLPKDSHIAYEELARSQFHQAHIHMHDHNEILFITTDSECEIFSNGSVCRVRCPACVIHRGGSYHSTTAVSTSAQGYSSSVVFFDAVSLAEFPESVTRRGIISGDCLVIPLGRDGLERFLPYLSLMRAHSGDMMQMKLLLLCLIDLIAPLAAGDNVTRMSSHSDYIFDAIAFITANAASEINSSDLAERFFVSVSKFNSDFRRVTGYSVKQYLIQLRLANARRLLASGEGSVAAVAYASGFSGESYFIQAFRTHFGITPGQYKSSFK